MGLHLSLPEHGLLGSNSSRQKRKRVLILAHFLGNDTRWIDDFCHREGIDFQKAVYPGTHRSWHERGPNTPSTEWWDYLSYVWQSVRRWQPDCVVTCFPPMALLAALVLKATGKTRVRLIAWDFNLGSLPAPWKGRIAGMVLSRVDRFIVHASAEIRMYSQWLRVPEDRFRFVPLQRGAIEQTKQSTIAKPYIVSMGSANRDYDTLVKSVLGTGIRTVIVSKRETVASLPEHPDLIKLHSLTPEECNSILQGAVLNVVPMSGTEAVSGQVTFTTGMRMGIPTITTRCVGTMDYIRDRETGLLVAPGDPYALRQAIRTLWDDVGLRDRVALAGRHYADAHFSDEAAGEYLARAIAEVL